VLPPNEKFVAHEMHFVPRMWHQPKILTMSCQFCAKNMHATGWSWPSCGRCHVRDSKCIFSTTDLSFSNAEHWGYTKATIPCHWHSMFVFKFKCKPWGAALIAFKWKHGLNRSEQHLNLVVFCMQSVGSQSVSRQSLSEIPL